AERAGVVAVVARLRGGDRADDLEGGYQRLLDEALVLRDELLDPGEGLLDALLPEHAERRRPRRAVHGHHPAPREDGDPTAAQLRGGERALQRALPGIGRAEAPAEREDPAGRIAPGRRPHRGDGLAAAAHVPAGELGDGAARRL